MTLTSSKNFFNFFRKFFGRTEIYTDGSHKGKWGSWAFVIVKGGKIIFESSGRESKTDSHHMEFRAAIEALKYLRPGRKATLYTDSRIVLDAISGEKIPSNNQEQSAALKDLNLQHNISWKWVRGHSGNPFNERCDELCVQQRGHSKRRLWASS